MTGGEAILDVERRVLTREIEDGELEIAAFDARIRALQHQRDRCVLTVARWKQELAEMGK